MGLVCRIAELAAAEGKAVVIVVNKWDTVDDKTAEAMKTAQANIKAELRQVSWAKCLFTSATQGELSLNAIDSRVMMYAHSMHCVSLHLHVFLPKLSSLAVLFHVAA